MCCLPLNYESKLNAPMNHESKVNASAFESYDRIVKSFDCIETQMIGIQVREIVTAEELKRQHTYIFH